MKTKMKSTFDIAKNPLDKGEMWFKRVTHEKTHLLNSKRQVWSSVSEVLKSSDELLYLLGVDHDGVIALDERVELRAKVNRSLFFVAVEVGFNSAPQVVGMLIRFHGDIQDLFRDGALKPGENDIISLHPGRIIGASFSSIDVMEQTKFAAKGLEVLAPLGIVGLGELKRDWYVGASIDHAEGGGGGSNSRGDGHV